MKMSRNLFVSVAIIFAIKALVTGQRLFINSLNQRIVNIYENRNYLKCEVENYLRASQFSWFDENGVQIFNGSNIAIHSNIRTSTLTFEKPNDAINGVYTCKAIVNGRQLEAKTRMEYVNKKFGIFFENCTKEIKVIEDSHRNLLLCNVNSHDWPDVTVTKTETPEAPVYSIVDEKVLLSAPFSEGNYTITATLKHISMSEKVNVYVTVLKTPKIGIIDRGDCLVEKEIMDKTCDVTSEAVYTSGNETITFVCIVSLNTNIDVKWLKNEKFFRNGAMTVHPYNKALAVTKLRIKPTSMDGSIYGNYSCRFSIDMRSSTSTVKLMKLRAPSAPTNFTYDVYSESVKLRINVEEQNNLLIKYLSYRYNSSTFITVPVNVTRENKDLVVIAFIDNLNQGAHYTIEFTLNNDAGMSNITKINVKTIVLSSTTPIAYLYTLTKIFPETKIYTSFAAFASPTNIILMVGTSLIGVFVIVLYLQLMLKRSRAAQKQSICYYSVPVDDGCSINMCDETNSGHISVPKSIKLLPSTSEDTSTSFKKQNEPAEPPARVEIPV